MPVNQLDLIFSPNSLLPICASVFFLVYQLCAGLSSDLKSKFDLGSASDYRYLSQSSCYTIDGVDEIEEFEGTLKALTALQFSTEQIESIWQLLIAVLQIGNLRPEPNPEKSDLTIIANRAELKRATATLGLPSEDVLASALAYRSVTIRGSISMIPLTPDEVCANRDALAKTIYSKVFDYIVTRMNAVLFKDGDQTPIGQKSDQQKRSGRSIGILDIFGKERRRAAMSSIETQPLFQLYHSKHKHSYSHIAFSLCAHFSSSSARLRNI